MKLKKELVDELIRLSKNYYETIEVDNLSALFGAEDELELKGKTTLAMIALIRDLAMFTLRSGKGTYKDIYKALEVFGVIVE